MASLELQLAAVRRRPAPRLTHLHGSDFEDIAIAGALLRVLSAAEDFAYSSLLREFERRAPIMNPQVGRLWDMTSADLGMTWQRLCRAWADLLGVNVEGAVEYKQLQPFTDARNAMVHGMGELTRKQRSKNDGAAVRGNLAKAGIKLVGNTVTLDQSNIAGAAHTAVMFIEWLDSQCRTIA